LVQAREKNYLGHRWSNLNAQPKQKEWSTMKESKAVKQKAKTVEKVEVGDFAGIGQEFGRTPDLKNQFGLARGTAYNLLNLGKIKGVVLRVRGQKSGVRLWDMASVRDYIRGEMEASSQ
jgi:hypothetical protein